MPKIKGIVDKSDVKNFLNDKYMESIEYKKRSAMLNLFESKKFNGIVDVCPYCKAEFEAKKDNITVIDKGGLKIFAKADCDKCHKPIYFKLITEARSLDPLFGGKLEVTYIIMTEDEYLGRKKLDEEDDEDEDIVNTGNEE